jgi:hypothetical protein
MFWQLFSFLIFAYFFYTRVWKLYSQIAYYKRQGVSFHSGIVPFFGSYMKLMPYSKHSKSHPLVDFCQDTFYAKCKGKENVP